MKFWVGVTDTKWYEYLRGRNPEDVNFWQPSGQHRDFKMIEEGAPFLFKLKAPFNAIGGVGFFLTQKYFPLSVVWDAFEERNGCSSYSEFKGMIDLYRKKNGSEIQINPVVGCVILTNPVFFRNEDWIPVPEDWRGPIVQGKTYSDEQPIGARLWNEVQTRLAGYKFYEKKEEQENQLMLEASLSDAPRYKETVLSKVRLGQGAFRVLVTEAYQGRCAITGEHTLPVLEAAHIKPYAELGPHLVSNGILMRSDLHKLFDTGYITITEDLRLEVSARIKEEYNNGKAYYAMAGQRLLVTPELMRDLPNKEFLRWHNEKVYEAH